jgi:peptide/nickel transport system substrate-binding protein
LTLRRRTLAQAAALLALPLSLSDALAGHARDSLVLGLALEPTSLDPTTAPAAAIGEIVHYNVLEGLTKVSASGAVLPLLAEDWRSDPQGKVYTFKLRRGVKFQDGTSFDAAAVKFSFDRARAAASTNQAKKSLFDNIVDVSTPQPDRVVLTLRNADATLAFRLGETTAVILSPRSAASAATQPIGTGPFKFDAWQRGSALTLVKWNGFRDARSIKLRKVSFRFVSDPTAQVEALLAGDIDAMPRFGAVQSLARFKGDKRFTVEIGSLSGKGLLAINNRRKPLDDLRVRRAIAHAIDRQAFIDDVLDGLATPIGSHAAPTDLGYVDLTGLYPFNPDKARALLKEAGVAKPLKLTLSLPPPGYARRGGAVVAAMLAEVGINAKIEKVDWAQWLAGPFKGQFDLTLINHFEPLDYLRYSDPAYYWGYDNMVFNELVKQRAEASRGALQVRLYGEIQRQLATDAVNAFLFTPSQVSVSKRGLKGLWSSSPILANDLSQVSWS